MSKEAAHERVSCAERLASCPSDLAKRLHTHTASANRASATSSDPTDSLSLRARAALEDAHLTVASAALSAPGVLNCTAALGDTSPQRLPFLPPLPLLPCLLRRLLGAFPRASTQKRMPCARAPHVVPPFGRHSNLPQLCKAKRNNQKA